MKAYILGIVMNFVAAIVLFGQGTAEMNNLDTSIPAILCVIAGVFGICKSGGTERSCQRTALTGSNR